MKEAKLRALTRDLEVHSDQQDYYSTNRYYKDDSEEDDGEIPIVTLADFELALTKVKPSVTEKDEQRYHELARQVKSTLGKG